LALVAMTYEDSSAFNLREGCLLRPVNPKMTWKEVWLDKAKDKELPITHDDALKYAKQTIEKDRFEVKEGQQNNDFDQGTAEAWVAMPKKNRKKLAKKSHPSEAIK
jgi:hypothetical protein